jgi:hypothetical protein
VLHSKNLINSQIDMAIN